MDIRHLLSHHIPRHLSGTICILSFSAGAGVLRAQAAGSRGRASSTLLLGNWRRTDPRSPPHCCTDFVYGTISGFSYSPHYNSALHSSFLTKDMSHHRAGTAPRQGGACSPHFAQQSPCQQLCDMTVNKVTFGINWGWRGCSKSKRQPT